MRHRSWYAQATARWLTEERDRARERAAVLAADRDDAHRRAVTAETARAEMRRDLNAAGADNVALSKRAADAEGRLDDLLTTIGRVVVPDLNGERRKCSPAPQTAIGEIERLGDRLRAAEAALREIMGARRIVDPDSDAEEWIEFANRLRLMARQALRAAPADGRGEGRADA